MSGDERHTPRAEASWPRRIVVKGISAAGKSTLAADLARRLDVPYIELDALHHGLTVFTPAGEVTGAAHRRR